MLSPVLRVAMGNALSWVISAIFGDKEARILILGLDNGTHVSSSVPPHGLVVIRVLTSIFCPVSSPSRLLGSFRVDLRG